MKKIILFLLIISSSVRAENFTLEITEIFPNPKGKDNSDLQNLEFIEIHNYGGLIVSLENVKIKNNKNKTLKLFNFFKEIKQNEYLAIYPLNKFVLKNSDEKIFLFYNNLILDEFEYSYSDEGLSWSKIDNLWSIAKITPGKENLLIKNDNNESKNFNQKNALNNKKNIYNSELKNDLKDKNAEYENLLNLTNKENKAVYESNSLKQKRLGLYFFSLTLVFVIITLLIENGRQGSKGKGNNRGSRHAY